MMPLFFGFLNMSFADILDIVLVAGVIYVVFRWIRGSSAVSIFLAILSLYLIRLVASILNMRMLNALMETVLDVGVLALIVIFQPEIRRFLISLGNRYRDASKGSNIFSRLFHDESGEMGDEAVLELCEACQSMSRDKTGALIVLEHSIKLNEIADSGDRIDAGINRRLLMNLFFKNSPLHDGAVIISGGRIVAARCTLPITRKTDLPAHYGMRHKAAVGVSEETDAEVIVVSEETGGISYVKNGSILPVDKAQLYHILADSRVSGTE